MRFWHDHSLSIVTIGVGILIVAASIPLREGTWFDIISQTGGSLLGAGLVNVLAGPLREVNKPEE